MVFTSSVFILIFLPLLLLCYFLIPKKYLNAKNLVLLAFSLVFYGWGGVRYLGLLLSSVMINYLGGLLCGILPKKGARRAALVITLAINLGLLGIFKYAGFGAQVLVDLGLRIPVPEIVLPIGISFFTFQGLSYVVDVYREDAAVQKDPLKVALYVSLFPQLVAGPIVRYTQVERELSQRAHTMENFSKGATRFMLGFGKKMLMANPMGEIADTVFGRCGSALLTTPLAWVGAIAYTLQIYFDFSAYSDMAIGLGRIFGFYFAENFNYPYISKSITEFWRRWHISLSTWFRDYVYIPLGGNRCSVARHILNIAIVWALTGLWHGAAWNFILWGIFNGLFLLAEKYLFPNLIKKIPALFRHLGTMLVVILGWVLFRAESLQQCGEYIAALFGAGGGEWKESLYLLRQYWPEWLLCLIGIFPLKGWLERYFAKREQRSGFAALKALLPMVFAFIVFALSYMKLVSGSFNPFIYFQF